MLLSCPQDKVQSQSAQIAADILYISLFRTDEDDEICAACTNPRVEQDKKKKTNQNNWRAVFWREIAACLENSSTLPVDAIGFLCLQHRRKHRTNTIIFWFEFLFVLLNSGGKIDPVYGSTTCRNLLGEGLAWYEPTSPLDQAAFAEWVNQLVFDRQRTGSIMVQLIQSALKLDYRSVETHFGQLVSGKCFLDPKDQRSRIGMVLLAFECFAETRRVSQWVEFMSGIVLNDKWFGDNLELLSWFRLELIRSFRLHVTEHHTPQIWKAFLHQVEIRENILEDEMLPAAFEAFLLTLRYGGAVDASMAAGANVAASESVQQTIAHTEKVRDLTTQRLLHGLGNSAESLTWIRLLRTCTLLLRLCDTMGDEETMTTSAVLEPKSKKKLFRMFQETQGLVAKESQVEMALACLDCLISQDHSQTELNRTIMNWCAEVLFAVGSADLLLRTFSSHPSCMNLLSESNCVQMWRKICIEKEEAFVQLLGKAYFFEMVCFQSSFLPFVKSIIENRDVVESKANTLNTVLRLAAEFPSGFLTEPMLRKMVKISFKAETGLISPDVFCDFLLSSTSSKTIAKAFNSSAQELLQFANSLKNPSEGKRLVRLIEAFVLTIKCQEEIPSLAQQVISQWGYSFELSGLMNGFSQRLREHANQGSNESKNDLLEVGNQILKLSTKEHAALCVSSSGLRLAQAMAGIEDKRMFAFTEPLSLLPLLAEVSRKLYASVILDDEIVQSLEAIAGASHLFNPELDASSVCILFGLAIYLNARFGAGKPLEQLLHHSKSHQVATLLDSAMADAWSDSCEAQTTAAKTFRTLIEFRIRRNYEQVVLRRLQPLCVALVHLTQSSQCENDAWGALIALANSDVLRDQLTSKELQVILSSTTGSRNVSKIRFLQLVSELHPRIVSRHLSAAFARAIASLEQDILFSKDHSFSEQELVTVAQELVRLCESLKPMESSFKHHAVSLLSDHITLTYVKGLASDKLRRPLELIAFYLLDLCGDNELQQLHAVLGGGVGGARRETLRRLVEDHQRTHVFKGKI